MAEFHAAQGDETPFVCGECGEPVFVLDGGRAVRPCGHESATIIANMTAIAKGASALK